ncbi:hypothetical protein Hanom_Chr06g00533951 [Helianthus anomalus]
MAEENPHEENPGEEGPLRVLKWDLGLFEQITRGFWFPPEWDARYPGQNQTVADAPPGYITLFEDFFLQGNFRCRRQISWPIYFSIMGFIFRRRVHPAWLG